MNHHNGRRLLLTTGGRRPAGCAAAATQLAGRPASRLLAQVYRSVALLGPRSSTQLASCRLHASNLQVSRTVVGGNLAYARRESLAIHHDVLGQ